MVPKAVVKVRRRVNGIKAQIERCPWWLIFIFAVLLLFGAGFGCGYYCGANVYDHSIGDGAAQRQLDQAQENQHAITDRELKTLRNELATSKMELDEARKQSIVLKNQLDELTAASKKQETSLKTVNESLKAYAREEKRTRLRIKAQRNTWEAVAAGLLIAWAAK